MPNTELVISAESTAPRVLIVEDDPDLVRNLGDFLVSRHYRVDCVGDGLSALDRLASANYDIVILDIVLPGLDGLEVCRRLRANGAADPAVVMLTARDSLDDKADAFDSGADDYIVKPPSLREVEMRIRALLRRMRRRSATVMEIADLRLDLARMEVTRCGMRIELPPIPLRILTILLLRAPHVVLRQTLESEIWGRPQANSHAINVHLHVLRNAIDKKFDRPLLHTVRGFGFRLAAD